MKMGVKTEVPGLSKTPDGWTLRAKSAVGSVTTEKRAKLVGATKAEAMVALEQLQHEALAESSQRRSRRARHQDDPFGVRQALRRGARRQSDARADSAEHG